MGEMKDVLEMTHEEIQKYNIAAIKFVVRAVNNYPIRKFNNKFQEKKCVICSKFISGIYYNGVSSNGCVNCVDKVAILLPDVIDIKGRYLIKKCSKCKSNLLISKFGGNKTQKDKLSKWCKKCSVEATARYYEKNTEKCYKSTRLWILNNYERHRRYDTDRCRKKKQEWKERNNASARKVTTAKCSKCGIIAIRTIDILAKFSISVKITASGLNNWCKKCLIEYNKDKRLNNLIEHRKRDAEHRKRRTAKPKHIAKEICKNTSLNPEDIPKEVIDLRISLLLLRRKILEINKQKREENGT